MGLLKKSYEERVSSVGGQVGALLEAAKAADVAATDLIVELHQEERRLAALRAEAAATQTLASNLVKLSEKVVE